MKEGGDSYILTTIPHGNFQHFFWFNFNFVNWFLANFSSGEGRRRSWLELKEEETFHYISHFISC